MFKQQKCEAKEQGDLKHSKMNLFRKLDWDVYFIIWTSSALLESPLTLGAWGKLSPQLATALG